MVPCRRAIARGPSRIWSDVTTALPTSTSRGLFWKRSARPGPPTQNTLSSARAYSAPSRPKVFQDAISDIRRGTGKGSLASFDGATEWINSRPLTLADLRGKVVLVQFWTFACYNCLNALPHVKALEAKYRDKGLVVIGVHTPELPHERALSNVRSEVKRLGIRYPVVIDNDYKIWRAYHNEYRPAAYYADATGKIRFYHFR